MTTLLPQIFDALDRFHAAHPWDHNAHYHRWIMRRLPQHFGRALDVGAGSGDLAHLLASRATSVQGLDADPTIVARARELTGTAIPVQFTVGDALTDIPHGPYDVITCVATIHHLPFSDTLTHLRTHLARGGTLIVVGVAQSRSDRLLGTAAIAMNVAMAWVKNKGRKAPRPVSMPPPPGRRP